MEMIPIQVTDEGVLIPKSYLHDAGEVEVIVAEDYVLVRPKLPTEANGAEPDSQVRKSGHRYSFVGIAHTRNPRASVEAEVILEREVNPRIGWEFPEWRHCSIPVFSSRLWLRTTHFTSRARQLWKTRMNPFSRMLYCPNSRIF